MQTKNELSDPSCLKGARQPLNSSCRAGPAASDVILSTARNSRNSAHGNDDDDTAPYIIGERMETNITLALLCRKSNCFSPL